MPGINQNLERGWCRNREEVTYTGRWAIGATGAVGAKVAGQGMTLTRTGVGLYTLTLDATPAAITHVDPRNISNTHTINPLTATTVGTMTFRVGLLASPQTAAETTSGDNITIQVTALRSLIK